MRFVAGARACATTGGAVTKFAVQAAFKSAVCGDGPANADAAADKMEVVWVGWHTLAADACVAVMGAEAARVAVGAGVAPGNAYAVLANLKQINMD